MTKYIIFIVLMLSFISCFSDSHSSDDPLLSLLLSSDRLTFLSDNNDSTSIKVEAIYKDHKEDVSSKADLFIDTYKINSPFTTYIQGTYSINATYNNIKSNTITIEATKPESFFYKGADISFLPELEDDNVIFKNLDGINSELLDILKENGFNTIRLRLWVDNEYCNLKKTLYMAKKIRESGLNFLLDFHYSDTWADPKSQHKPSSWKNLSFEELNSTIYLYTKEVLDKLIEQGTPPQLVQIGNEINNGFLHPEGHVDSFSNLSKLLSSASKAVSDSFDYNKPKVILHIAGYDSADWFFSKIKENNVNYDLIALSYYPWWHGTNLKDLNNNLFTLKEKFKKDIIIMETAYPWTLKWNDFTDNLLGSDDKLIDIYPPSIEGQNAFLKDLIQNLKNDNLSSGIFYWAPEWVSSKGPEATNGSSWENLTLFDFENKALESLKAFKN